MTVFGRLRSAKRRAFEEPAATTSIKSVTATSDAEGSAIVHFGGERKASNYLQTMPGWNYLDRLYWPRPEFIDGRWTFPAATPD